MTKNGSINAGEISAIAKDAYIYAFDMLENYKTLYEQAVDPTSPEHAGGFNRFRHWSKPFSSFNYDIVASNMDISYSSAWLDLRAEPIVFSVQKMMPDRYYIAQCFDLFMHTIANIGPRTDDCKVCNYLLYGPHWHGTIPTGITDSFSSRTDLVSLSIQTALENIDDEPYAQVFQAHYSLQPLSMFLGKSPLPSARPICFPLYNSIKAQSRNFINYLNFILEFCQLSNKENIMQRLACIGIGPGLPWHSEEFDPAFLSAIDAGIEAAKEEIQPRRENKVLVKDIIGSLTTIENKPSRHTVLPLKSSYINTTQQIWYGGYVANGAQQYTIYFPAGHLPPAKFFWSITIYTLPEWLQVDNPINRYAVGDRTIGVKYGEDGSLMLYIQHDSPGKALESNWLPAPLSAFCLILRVYGPELTLIKGFWKLPPLLVVKSNKTIAPQVACSTA